MKKQKKKDALFNTAFELFTTKGTNQTTISDIVNKAGVAKGTFYLYFKDKYVFATSLSLIRLQNFFIRPTVRSSNRKSQVSENSFTL